MPEATNAQMQTFADQRIRPRAEAFRALRSACLDDKAAIDDEYSRAIGANRWDDARTDGPPHLLASGGNAAPDDVEDYNSFISLFEKFLTGTFATLAEANSAAAAYTTVKRAVVRPSTG